MKNIESSRRGFFKTVAIGGAAAAAAVATTLVGKPNAATDKVVAEDRKQVGYRETAHVRHYYRTTQV